MTGAHQIYDSAATAAFFLVCELAGKGDASSLKVLLSRSEPRDVTLYRQAFGARLFFNTAQTAVVLPSEILD